MLCQTENPSKAEAAGIEAREGRSGPPGPAPPATAPLPQPAQRPGRAGPGRTPGAGGPGAGRGCERRGRGREQPQDGGSPAAALGVPWLRRAPAAASAPGVSPVSGAASPGVREQNELLPPPAAPGAPLVAAVTCPQPALQAGQSRRCPPLLGRAGAGSPPVIGPSQRHLQLSGADSGAGSRQQPVPELPTLLPTFRAVRAPRNKTPCFPRAIVFHKFGQSVISAVKTENWQ